MPKGEIVVTIEDGKAKVETKGFEGKACLDATADLERAMGITTQDDKTPEFHQKTVRQVGN